MEINQVVVWVLPETRRAFPIADCTVKYTVLFSLSLLLSHSCFSWSYSAPSSLGSLKSLFRSPLGSTKLTKSSSSTSATSYYWLEMMGTSTVVVRDNTSSYFLLVKMSTPTIVALAGRPLDDTDAV